MSTGNELRSMVLRCFWRLSYYCIFFRLTCGSTGAIASSPSIPVIPVAPSTPTPTPGTGRKISEAEIESTNQRLPAHGKEKHKHLDLDFSGRIETHVVGSGDVNLEGSDRRQPLVPLALPFGNPSLYVAADYNFAKCRYGVTRLSSTLRFLLRRPFTSESAREHGSVYHHRRPLTLDVTLERHFIGGTARERLGGTVCSLRWPWSFSRDSKVSVRNNQQQTIQSDEIVFSCNPGQKLSLFVPLHRRLCWEGTLFHPHRTTASNNGSPSHSHRDCGVGVGIGAGTNQETDNDWWIPTVRVDALGQMVSTNELSFPQSGINVKLSVSRRVNWGVLGGFLSHETAETTTVRLRIHGLSFPGTLSNTVLFESLLERPLQSARLLIQQNTMIGSYSG